MRTNHQVQWLAVFTLIAITLTLMLSSCGWFSHQVQPVVNNIINCAKAEEAEVTKNASIISVALDVAAQIVSAIPDGLDAVYAVVAKLVTLYGEPIVACVVKAEVSKLLPPTPAPVPAPDDAGTKALTAVAPSIPQSIISHFGWQFASSP